jgi:hypothetical protein
VKTTSSKQHKKFVVTSEKQLDSTGLNHLYLALFSINLHNNMLERTLPALIREIYEQIASDAVATFQLQMRLTKYGYLPKDEEKYRLGFSIGSVNYFEVRDGFPRLLQRNLPEGVGDLKYSVVVSACSRFEITRSILNLI